jgi:hypothetical protein
MRVRFLLTLWIAVGAASARAADAPDFDRQIAPLLAGRCLDCHSGAEPKGGLDLLGSKGLAKGGDSGEAVVLAGKPAESLLWQRISADEMPPKHPLPAGEKGLLKAWIAAGAKWGTDPIDPFRYTSASRAGYDWWSLRPLVRPEVPRIRNPQSAIRNPIDAFILHSLDSNQLTASPPADPRTLLRRLYFDLTGLPPTPEEIDAFVLPSRLPAVSPSSDREGETERRRERERYEAVVDRLLSSPHYGERWARHWLDVAHFGESDGYEYDRMRPHAWRYRDWVIGAFNRDMPFYEFARLQIAGDVLQPDSADAITATGFLVAGAHDSLMPKGEALQKIMRQDELEDVVGVVGQTFLGLTVHCARCHDHKFDPIRQTDYYRLAAALAGVKRGNRDIPAEPPDELIAAHAAADKELAAIVGPAKESILAKRRAAAGERAKPPEPIARWEFDEGPNDSIGSLHAKLMGKARIEEGGLVLDGKEAYAATIPLEKDLAEKTLEAWVWLSGLDQRGGGLIGVQKLDGSVFDSLVFGEKEPLRWLAGSDFFRRTKAFDQATDEREAGERFIHVALVYSSDKRIAAYRNGQPYGEPYQADALATFAAGKTQVIFGMRHGPPGGNKMLAGRIDRAALYDRALSPDEIAASAGAVRTSVSIAEIDAELDAPARARRQQLAAEVARLAGEINGYRDRKVFAVTPQTAPVAHLLIRGNPAQPGDVVSPAGIGVLPGADLGLSPDASDADRRRKLAEWIASEHNPLFARTIVNRVWHYHFGRGLVETPSDLGFNGGQPSHRELLDWLACELIDKKWSLKELHKLIVMSSTYQQASRPRAECLAVDADNRLLWRYSPRRLEAEAVRDAMLSAAGQLNPAVGGPSVQDFRPFEYKSTQYYEPIDPVGHEFNRRSIYRMWARGGKNPLLDTFDCPDPSTTTPKRGATTTPLQALSLLNNSFTLRMADHLAERLEKDQPGKPDEQIVRGFELTCGRPPSADEQTASAAFVREHGLAAFCRVLLNTNAFLYVN